ncbi:MAG: Pyruvate kinase, partial [uncultured Thermomicrobiales bacterium]
GTEDPYGTGGRWGVRPDHPRWQGRDRPRDCSHDRIPNRHRLREPAWRDRAKLAHPDRGRPDRTPRRECPCRIGHLHGGPGWSIERSPRCHPARGPDPRGGTDRGRPRRHRIRHRPPRRVPRPQLRQRCQRPRRGPSRDRVARQGCPGSDRQDRAGRGARQRPADRRRGRRPDGRPRRPGCPTSAGARSAGPEGDHQRRQRVRPPGDHGDPDARVDDHPARSHSGRDQRRRQRRLGRDGRGDALRRVGDGEVSRRGGPDDGPHHPRDREGRHRPLGLGREEAPECRGHRTASRGRDRSRRVHPVRPDPREPDRGLHPGWIGRPPGGEVPPRPADHRRLHRGDGGLPPQPGLGRPEHGLADGRRTGRDVPDGRPGDRRRRLGHGGRLRADRRQPADAPCLGPDELAPHPPAGHL